MAEPRVSVFIMSLVFSVVLKESSSVRLKECELLGEYIRDTEDPCIYYHCDYTHINSVEFSAITRACAPGSAVPYSFTAGVGSPCSEINPYCDGVLRPGSGGGGGGGGGGKPEPPTIPTEAPPTMKPPVPAHGVIPDSGCPGPLRKYENSNVFGGVIVRAVMEEEGCKQFCLQSLECAAVDFDKERLLCFVFTFKNIGRRNIGISCCNHYQRMTCSPQKGLPDKFLDYAPGYHVFGGVPLQGKFSLDACFTSCNQDLHCEAIDYNADQSCWFHNKTTSCNALSAKPYCTHYTKLTCGSPLPNLKPPEGFTSLNVGYHIFGGTELDGEMTLQECVDVCRRADVRTCSAVDYDSATGGCFIHSSVTACNAMIAKDQCTTFGRVQFCSDTKRK